MPLPTALAVTPSPEFHFRRNALLVILGGATVTSIISLIVGAAWSFDLLDRAGLTLIVVKNAVLFTWLWRSPQHFAAVGVTELLFEALGGVAKYGYTLLGEHTMNGFTGYAYWLVLSYFVASLVLPARAALAASGLIFSSLLAITLAYWFSPVIPGEVKQAYGNLILQMHLTHVTFIAFLAVQGLLLRQYLSAILAAQGEAHFANTDALTGLANRRQLNVWLAGWHARAHATGESASAVLFDLDHFKRVNDTFGHDAGDRVLRDVASAAQRVLREGDQLGRWGGEEFLVILPRTGSAQAREVAERLQVAAGSLAHEEVGHVTVSCGVATLKPGESVHEWLKRADAALYAAKHRGRDAVAVAELA